MSKSLNIVKAFNIMRFIKLFSSLHGILGQSIINLGDSMVIACG